MLNCVSDWCRVHFYSLKNAVRSAGWQTVRPTHKSLADKKKETYLKSSLYSVKILKSYSFSKHNPESKTKPYIHFRGGNKTNHRTPRKPQALDLEAMFAQTLQQVSDRLQLQALIKRKKISGCLECIFWSSDGYRGTLQNLRLSTKRRYKGRRLII